MSLTQIDKIFLYTIIALAITLLITRLEADHLKRIIDKLNGWEAMEGRRLKPDELKNMVGQWVWVEVRYSKGTTSGWAFIGSRKWLGYLEKGLPVEDCGRTYYAYASKPIDRER